MPNHCRNNLTVSGPKMELVKFFRGINDDGENCSILKTYYPCPKELLEQVSNYTERPDMKAKYGYSDWYGWCCDNWGTKWGDYDLNIELFEDCISADFDSAWAPPISGLVGVSKKFPELKFELEYDEPGMEFAGVAVIKDGVVLQHDEAEYDSDDE